MKTYKIIASLSLLFWCSCAHLPPEQNASRPFQFKTDRAGFSNETVWNYVDGDVKSQRDRPQSTGEHYSRRCFVLSRAAVQFWKFARFDHSLPPLSDRELTSRIREVTTIDTWRAPFAPEKRILFPGYLSFHDITAAHPKIFQDNLGLGWPVYCRIGNMPLIVPVTRNYEENLYQEILKDLKKGYPTIIWLANFPRLNINHAVTLYSILKTDSKQTVFLIYDPNNHESPQKLTYDSKSKSFSFQKTFYFKGGFVNVRPLYRNPFQ